MLKRAGKREIQKIYGVKIKVWGYHQNCFILDMEK